MLPKTHTSTVLSNSRSYIQYVWSLQRTICCPWGASYGHSSKPRTWTSISSSRYGTLRTAKATSNTRFRSVVTTRISRSKDWTGMFKSSNFFRSSVLEPWSKTNHFFQFQLSRFFSPAGYWMQSIRIFECSNIQFWDTCIYPMHTMLSVLQEPMQQEEFPIIYYSRYCHRELSHLLHFYYFHFL